MGKRLLRKRNKQSTNWKANCGSKVIQVLTITAGLWDIKSLLRYWNISALQYQRIGADKIRDELRKYGAWDATELADDTENMKRILWLAAGDILEDIATGKR